MQTLQQKAIELQEKAKAKGLCMNHACRLAEVTQATFCRWKSGKHAPMMEKFERLRAVIEGYKPEGGRA